MPIDEDGLVYGNWSLGDDDYCETCGSSYNEVRFQQYYEDYSLYTSEGCYGGQSYKIEELDQLFKDIDRYELFTDSMRISIINTIGEYLEKVENEAG